MKEINMCTKYWRSKISLAVRNWTVIYTMPEWSIRRQTITKRLQFIGGQIFWDYVIKLKISN